jgi:hypothetical protein
MSTSPDGVSVPAKRQTGRSPSYPAINLETAIQRARQLHEKDRQLLTPVAAVVQHWGYKSFNGPASLTLAALKKFGLLEDEGSGDTRRARVSDLAVEILRNPDEQARRAAIQRAALNPPIHVELWEKYGSALPSDLNLHWELTRDRGFTETGAKEFISEYRATIAFAQLGVGATVMPQTAKVSEFEHDDDDAMDGDETPPSSRGRLWRPRRTSETAAVYTIPLAGRAPLTVEGEFPITEQDWTQFMAVLNAMKPGLVSNERQPDGHLDE